MIKLLGMFKSRIIKDKNGENVPRLEITEVALIQCNIVNNNYQQNSIHLYFQVSTQNFWYISSVACWLEFYAIRYRR